LQQEYFHTRKACSGLYFEIAMNMENHEKKGRNLSLFSCQEFKRLHPFNYFRKKRYENVL